jgi:hypothetical protein
MVSYRRRKFLDRGIGHLRLVETTPDFRRQKSIN